MKERILKILVFLYLLLMFAAGFVWMALLQGDVLDSMSIGPVILSLGKEYQLYGAAGTIGGTLYALRLFYWHNIRGILNIRKWWIWYFLRPIMSAGTAVMTVILFQSGILLINIADSLMPRIGFSFLIGYGFGKVMDKLDGLTEALFNGTAAKQSSETKNPDRSIEQMKQP
ncbi:hypothetical protein EFBL_1859 [Effusibacillus lacus]|uniref:Uncharacterized protein n=1 Tax=Effusibacillus lacus TaxID=1348429 RepID=A0A292YN98_9BACL|nr:hypothetical protein EFBL_1859 [Effusibacillus lacus]